MVNVITGSFFTSSNLVIRKAFGRSTGIDVNNDDVLEDIKSAERYVVNRYGDSRKTSFYIDTEHEKYEYTKTRVPSYRIVSFKIWNSSNNERTDLAEGDYTVDLNENEITLTEEQSTLYTGKYGEVDSIPMALHEIATVKAALIIASDNAEQSNPGEGGAEPVRVSRLRRELKDLEDDLLPTMVEGSWENRNFDKRKRQYITQYRFQKNPIA